ncbi:uncharacterized protein LOC124542783 [Vanessa cardui]|uniref:uncharacterized protein LOC124542783 n=1 Tax=Vanessa cardui TaxID=171605 RepID=UPI001F143CFF|nr:uncharacterized protein LOC124542783 [Vanessa cardui]
MIKLKKLVTLVSLDIEGAFDSAWWPAIRIRLAEEKVPVNIRRLLDSYLDERKVRLRYAGEETVRTTNKGCVQGSIGGPILWNLLLDPLLHQMEKKEYYCQAFADDIVLVFAGETALEIERQANAALGFAHEWGVANKMKFAPHKTCAMILTNKLKYDTPRLSMAGVRIGMSDEIKILGLTIDRKLTFNSHVANICAKGTDIYKRLSKAARGSWGLHPEIIRLIYTAAIEPIIIYAAAAWAPAAGKLGVQKHLNAVQRGFAQKLCKSYRTVSLNAALVLAGILPLDLRIQEAAALYEARRGSSRLVLGDRETERAAGFAEAPHPALQMDLEIRSLSDQYQVDRNNVQQVRIFTDGSKIDGRVGAALSLWNNEAETKAVKLSLPAYCTVYQAELLAICRATSEILKDNGSSFGLYSDSRAALETVTDQWNLHPLAEDIRRNLYEALMRNKTVSLFWVKAHAGLPGNECADYLAKEAALSSRRKPNYDQVPVSFVKRNICEKTLDEWNRRYQLGGTASVTRAFFPDAVIAHKTIRKIKPQGYLTQMLTGHGGSSEYLNRFKCKKNRSTISGIVAALLTGLSHTAN